MRLADDVKATVFKPEVMKNRNNTVKGIISVCEGKNQNEEYIYSNWITLFVGDAFEKAKSLNNKDHIIITSGKVTNEYNKEKKRAYYTLVVFDYEMRKEKAQTEEPSDNLEVAKEDMKTEDMED